MLKKVKLMMMTQFLVVSIMMSSVFASNENWEKFNSSLLIEVTRPHGIFTCSGVAITSTLLLTAAHCLEGKIQNIRVFTQEKYDPQLPSIGVSRFEIHPSYNPQQSRFYADLAKIYLSEKLPPTTKIYPIHQSSQLRGELYRFGFGQRNDKNLRTVLTPTIKNLNLDEKVLELHDEFSKSGDSGGPIFLKQGENISLIAIHSTYSYGPLGNFSLNPVLKSYSSWIYNL